VPCFLKICLAYVFRVLLVGPHKEQNRPFDNSVEPQRTLLQGDDENTTQPKDGIQMIGYTVIQTDSSPTPVPISYTSDQDNKYQVRREWGERVTRVKTKLETNEKVIALTLDGLFIKSYSII
ncbi:hypothetical protein ACOI1C_18865, partial [Bacillus sp. DJP31]|uniref:hypothetical protein n=1 Tax=Bacillus sp. DJP31 TaxID=3409789 RepID=UPI003BB788C8